jgi:hypothetical protein
MGTKDMHLERQMQQKKVFSQSKVVGGSMIKVLSLAGFFALASGIAFADSIVTGTWVNMPSSITNPGPGTGCGSAGPSPGSASSQCGLLGTGPYWDNDSGKGAYGNIGYFLTGTGMFTGDTNYNPLQYLASGPGSYSAPSSLTLDHTSSSAVVTLLGDATGDKSDQFGYYNVSNPSILYPLFGPGNLTGDIGDSLGLSNLVNSFYITKNCYFRCPVGDTAGTVTWYSNPSLDTTDAGNEHFVIFDSATTGVYYVGIEDWGLFGGMNSGEGNGDYNDIVFELTVPEPATFGLIGVGLAGLGLARLRARRLRART